MNILSSCRQLNDISPLASLSSLERLILDYCQGIRRFTPLESLLHTLKDLHLFGCKMYDLPPDVSGTNEKGEDVPGQNVLYKVRAYYEGRLTKDFLISYHPNDTAWANWTARTLEEAGYSFILQAWDFPADDDGLLKVWRLVSQATHTIVLLSQNYLQMGLAPSDWEIAFKHDPERRIHREQCAATPHSGSNVLFNSYSIDQTSAKGTFLRACPCRIPIPDLYTHPGKRWRLGKRRRWCERNTGWQP